MSNDLKTIIGEDIKFDDTIINQNINDLNIKQSELSNRIYNECKFDNLNIRSSTFTAFNFTLCDISNSSCSHYLFNKSSFKNCKIIESDFSGGGFDEFDFTNSLIENSDFALCEFKSIKFNSVKFINCNFNGSVFEDIDFDNAEFQNVTFKYVEGLTQKNIDYITSKGAVYAPPFEIKVKNHFLNILKIIPLSVKIFLLIIIVFFVGYKFDYLKYMFKTIINSPANPLSKPYSFLKSEHQKSFFYYNMNLPNYDFSDDLDYWLIDGNNPASVKSTVSDFKSFPKSLEVENFLGSIYYINKKNDFPSKNILDTESIWLDVNQETKKLKLSFNYKYGHPKFTVYGRFKDGGYKILAEVEELNNSNDNNWIYFSESIEILESLNAVCLKMHKFPETKIFLDDVNLENTI